MSLITYFLVVVSFVVGAIAAPSVVKSTYSNSNCAGTPFNLTYLYNANGCYSDSTDARYVVGWSSTRLTVLTLVSNSTTCPPTLASNVGGFLVDLLNTCLQTSASSSQIVYFFPDGYVPTIASDVLSLNGTGNSLTFTNYGASACAESYYNLDGDFFSSYVSASIAWSSVYLLQGSKICYSGNDKSNSISITTFPIFNTGVTTFLASSATISVLFCLTVILCSLFI